MQMDKEGNELTQDFLNDYKRLEKKRRKKTIWYENDEGEIIAKVCVKCGYAKLFEEFPKHNTGLGGREASCKSCKAEATRNWYKDNRETALENDLKYNEMNKDVRRKWQKANTERTSLAYQRRRARKAVLPDTLTIEDYAKTLEYFGNACALTGQKENIEQEHAIPISIGRGGTTFENCYPMHKRLNLSKFNHNIFEWFKVNRQRFELSQERFDNLIAYLASANAMTVEEYRDYVYWCHANPRSIDEIKEAL
jgi:predicted transposase YbfD/YdcC